MVKMWFGFTLFFASGEKKDVHGFLRPLHTKEWIKREEYLPNFFLENVSNAEKGLCGAISFIDAALDIG